MLKLIILGGLDGIGKNMMAIEYKDEILIIDVGIMFPDDDMYGVNKVLPDFTYLIQNKKKVKGIILTHGHEDHIGAIGYLLERMNIPVYGTRLTLGLVEHKLSEKGIVGTELKVVDEKSHIKFRHFQMRFLRVNHSIPDGVMTVIDTPEGIIVHSGDFKIDYTPVDDIILDTKRLADIGQKGVLLLLSDSTNAVKRGHTLSESQVGESFDRAFRRIKGRILVATFSSNIHRVQQAIDMGKKYGRKISFAGLSMENTSKIARRLGYLNYQDADLIFIGDVDKYPDDQILILTTGSQGEPMAALTRIAKDEYRLFQIKKGDTVIISALPIPGNEKSVYATIDKLGRKGIDVIYEEASKMHVSGHAYQEELKVLATLLRPKCFIPIHGEFRHLKAHTELVRDLGLTPHILIAENGDVIGISKKNGLQKVDRVPVRLFYLDSNDAWLEDDKLIGERQQMAHDGVVVVDFRENEVRVDSRGVSPDPDDFTKGLRDSIIDQYRYALQERRMSKDELISELEQITRKYMAKRTGKSPAVIVLVSGR